jgi:hypothetical protein
MTRRQGNSKKCKPIKRGQGKYQLWVPDVVGHMVSFHDTIEDLIEFANMIKDDIPYYLHADELEETENYHETKTFLS